MAEATVLLEIDGPIARMRFNRPQVLNAINDEMVADLRAALRVVQDDPAIRVMVLSGAGRAFMAGGDVEVFHAAGARAPAVLERLITPFHEAIELMAKLPFPVVASLHGAVAGAGVSMALAADLAVAADDATFTLAYARIGASPDGSATWSLPRVVGLRKALEIALLAESFGADEALRLGLVNRLVPASELAAATNELAGRLARGPTRAYASIRALMRESFDNDLATQMRAEGRGLIAAAATRDFAEGVAAFVEKRPAKFDGR
jgi:2-(1,2-epoxy-1,2-dihydrophenyl)acetyl-CoA isomerase